MLGTEFKSFLKRLGESVCQMGQELQCHNVLDKMQTVLACCHQRHQPMPERFSHQMEGH